MNNCDFCSKEVLKGQKIYSTELTTVIYPLRPIVFGHFMIISNSHTQTLDLLSSEEMLDIHVQLKNIVGLMRSKYSYTGYNLIVNSGKSAGQHVPHAHIHLLMRSEDEEYSPLDVLAGKTKMGTVSKNEWESRRNDFRGYLDSWS